MSSDAHRRHQVGPVSRGGGAQRGGDPRGQGGTRLHRILLQPASAARGVGPLTPVLFSKRSQKHPDFDMKRTCLKLLATNFFFNV